MSTISGNYSTVPLYPLYQAGQGSSASGSSVTQTNSQGTVSNQPSSNPAPQSGSLDAAQNALNTLQANLGSPTTTASSAPSDPAPKTYSISNSGGSTVQDPNASFISNQEANADYQSMILNLGHGDIAAAAKDYAQLQADLKLHGLHTGGSAAVDTNSAGSSGGSVFSVTV